MKFWVHDSDIREDGTLLREQGTWDVDDIPEVLRHDTMEWTPTPGLFMATEMTSEWNQITAEEAARIERHQRSRIRA